MRRLARGKSVQEADEFGLANHERIEQANFDVRMRFERGQRRVERRGDAEVVQQQAHTHAAIGGFMEFFEQQGAGQVVAPDVVLDVQRALRRADQIHASRKRHMRIGERIDAGGARMRCKPGGDGTAEQVVVGGLRRRQRISTPCDSRAMATRSRLACWRQSSNAEIPPIDRLIA